MMNDDDEAEKEDEGHEGEVCSDCIVKRFITLIVGTFSRLLLLRSGDGEACEPGKSKVT